MKKLRKIILALIISFSFINVSQSAESKGSLKVAIYAKEGGNSWVQGQMLNQSMIEAGYASEVMGTGNCLNLAKYLKDTKEKTPTIFLHSELSMGSHMEMGCRIVPKENNFVAVAFKRVNAMCAPVGKDWQAILKQDEITVAVTNTFPDVIFDELSKTTGKKIKRVTYDSSGSAYKGLVAGDTDLLYTGLTKREATSKAVTCFATTNDKKVGDMIPMKELFPGYKVAELSNLWYIYGHNLTAKQKKQLKEDLFAVIKTNKEWQEFIVPSKMIPGYELGNYKVADLIKNGKSWGYDIK
jgi:hypothetical protein